MHVAGKGHIPGLTNRRQPNRPITWEPELHREPDLHSQARAHAQGALATVSEMDWEPDLHAQARALEDGAVATDTDPGDGLLQGDEVCVRRREPRRPCELGDDPEALR